LNGVNLKFTGYLFLELSTWYFGTMVN
jgi:hypothetical protein